METQFETEYDVQAADFATKNGVTLDVLSHRFGSMAWDKDGTKRNIFKLKLSRNKKSYTFEFGSSVSDSCEKTTISKWDQLNESDNFKVYCGIKSDRLGYVFIEFELSKENASNITDEQIKDWANKFNDEKSSVIKKYNSKRSRIEHVEDSTRYQSGNIVRRAIDNTVRRLQDEKITTYVNPKKEIVSPSMYDVLTCLTKYDPCTFEDFCSDFGYDTDSRSAHTTYKAVTKEYKAVYELFSDVMDELQEIQ